MPGHRHRGSAATEVALVMSLLACGLLVAYARLGGQSQTVFRRLALEGLAGSSTSDTGLPTAGNEPQAFRSRVSDHRDEDTPIAAILLSLGAALGFLGIAAVLALRKRRTVALEDELPPEPATKISELPEALFAKRQDLLHLFENLIAETSGTLPTVGLVMSSRLSIVQPRTLVGELRRQMKEERLRHLLVCDRQGKLLGVVSDRDLAKPGETAERIMSQSPVSVSPETPLLSAVTMLINRRFSSLPVVEEEKPVGILTTTDILLAMQATVMLLQRK